VSHAFYRHHVEKGFERRAPPKLAFSKSFYYPIDDTVKRTLATSKYTNKLVEYTLSVSNAVFASTTHATAEDALAAHLARDAINTTTLLNQAINSLAKIKDMQRDRMFFLDLTSDPASTPTQRYFANNVLMNKFTPLSRIKEHRQEPTRSTPHTSPLSLGLPSSHPPRLPPHVISRPTTRVNHNLATAQEEGEAAPANFWGSSPELQQQTTPKKQDNCDEVGGHSNN